MLVKFFALYKYQILNILARCLIRKRSYARLAKFEDNEMSASLSISWANMTIPLYLLSLLTRVIDPVSILETISIANLCRVIILGIAAFLDIALIVDELILIRYYLLMWKTYRDVSRDTDDPEKIAEAIVEKVNGKQSKRKHKIRLMTKEEAEEKISKVHSEDVSDQERQKGA